MDENENKRRFSVTLTEPHVKDLVRYVEEGLYIDHQAAIREGLRRLSRFHGFETFSDKEVKASNSRIEAVRTYAKTLKMAAKNKTEINVSSVLVADALLEILEGS